ncbi:type II and III secretion system protein family protein [Pararhizobium polonicum]|uniref:type II and III secretion system protein family protein n=1 Tax=Pararhizobium polonicum TaxID=1612624 RepID=UPI003CC8A50C
MNRIGNKFRSSVVIGLAFCLAFSDMPGQAFTAEAASESVVRIVDSGPGVKKTIKLGLNKAIVVDLPADAHDILVADPSLADAVTRTSRRIYLFGKTVGQTNIFVFGPNGEEIVSLDLEIERDVAGLQANLRRFLPDSDINVEIISDNIVLTGTVRTPLDSTRVEELARAFIKGGEATTRNITAEGNAGSTADIFAETRQQSQIVNLLRIDGEDQVMLKVTVAEVSRQVLKQLGFSGSISKGNDNILFSNPANLGSAVNPFSSVITSSIGSTGISNYINAMEQAGVMRTLAEPSLTAISGKKASFSVGGEYRLPSSQEIGDDGTLSRETETVEYGIGLDFTPVVLGPGRISLEIATEVSEPTFEGSNVSGNAGALRIGAPGQTYMSIRRRKASTSIELPSGGSIVIGGLVQDNIRQAMSGVPGVSKIPVFGALFRSKDFVRNETELVIIATPYLVQPVARAALSRPDDNFNAANDLSSFFLGEVNRIYGNRQAAPAGQYHGNVGFIYK